MTINIYTYNILNIYIRTHTSKAYHKHKYSSGLQKQEFICKTYTKQKDSTKGQILNRIEDFKRDLKQCTV